MPYHVYRCYDQDGALLYVGSSRNLFGRLFAHRSKWWAGQVARVKAELHPDKPAAVGAERRTIQAEKRRCNIHHRWNGAPREHWTSEDYWHYAVALVMDQGGGTLRQRLQNASGERQRRFGEPLDWDALDELHRAVNGKGLDEIPGGDTYHRQMGEFHAKMRAERAS